MRPILFNLLLKKTNLEEMDRFLKIYNLSRLNHKEIENLKRPATSKEIESKISQQKKCRANPFKIFQKKKLKRKEHPKLIL